MGISCKVFKDPLTAWLSTLPPASEYGDFITTLLSSLSFFFYSLYKKLQPLYIIYINELTTSVLLLEIITQ